MKSCSLRWCGSFGWSAAPITKRLWVLCPVREHPRLWVGSSVGPRVCHNQSGHITRGNQWMLLFHFDASLPSFVPSSLFNSNGKISLGEDRNIKNGKIM